MSHITALVFVGTEHSISMLCFSKTMQRGYGTQAKSMRRYYTEVQTSGEKGLKQKIKGSVFGYFSQ